MLGAQGEAVAEAELRGAAHRLRSSGGLLTRRARGQGQGAGSARRSVCYPQQDSAGRVRGMNKRSCHRQRWWFEPTSLGPWRESD